jgi:MFS family permease
VKIFSLQPPKWWGRLRKSHVQRGLTIAVFEAGIAGIMLAAVDNWLVPLLQLRMHASPFIIGLLTYLPFLSMALVGPFAAPLIRFFGGNKRLMVIVGIIQIAMLLGLLVPVHRPDLPVSFALAVTLSVGIGVVGSLSGAAWLAWMSGLIPRRVRGRYWGNRLRILIGCKLVSTALFALIIQEFPITTQTFGISLVLLIAGVARILSVVLLCLQPESRTPIKPRARESITSSFTQPGGFMDFLRNIHRTELGRWTLIYSTLLYGVMIAGPFFPVYVLAGEPNGLGLGGSPILYVILLQTAWCTRVLIYTTIGRLIDRYGPTPIMRIAVMGAVLAPLAWAFTGSPWLIVLNEIMSGIVWCSIECSVGVQLLSSGADRARLLGFNQTCTSFAIFLGSITGGLLLANHVLPELHGTEFRTLFILSSIIRIPALLLALKYLPRHPELRIRLGRGARGALPPETRAKPAYLT